MTIRREDVLYVASLAHLELNEAEVESFRKQLDDILAYIAKLNELDVAEIEPMAQVLHRAARPGAALRDDQVLAPAEVAREVLEQAPQAAPPYFRVP